MAYQCRNTIFTHAGITNTWWRRFRDSIAAAKAMTIRSSIADFMETSQDAPNGYHQFVSHSALPEMKHFSWHGKSITFLDVLHKQAYFHEPHC
jgi:hypothetical protein